MMSKKSFIQFLFQNRVLLLGNFVTKSQRQTPYFFNFGQIYSGHALNIMGKYFANKIRESVGGKDFSSPTAVFGPAYKGIPLAISTVMSLKNQGEVSYAFNRKEVKDHGDGGVLVGKLLGPNDKVVIVDDVITSGISIRESIQLIQEEFGSQIIAIVVAVDRQELAESSSQITASEYISQSCGIPVKPIVTLMEIFTLARKYKLITPKEWKRVSDYFSNSFNASGSIHEKVTS